MNNDCMTLFREYVIASDSKQIVTGFWMSACLSDEADDVKEVLDSIRMYLYDRLQIALAFYSLAIRKGES